MPNTQPTSPKPTRPEESRRRRRSDYVGAGASVEYITEHGHLARLYTEAQISRMAASVAREGAREYRQELRDQRGLKKSKAHLRGVGRDSLVLLAEGSVRTVNSEAVASWAPAGSFSRGASAEGSRLRFSNLTKI